MDLVTGQGRSRRIANNKKYCIARASAAIFAASLSPTDPTQVDHNFGTQTDLKFLILNFENKKHLISSNIMRQT